MSSTSSEQKKYYPLWVIKSLRQRISCIKYELNCLKIDPNYNLQNLECYIKKDEDYVDKLKYPLIYFVLNDPTQKCGKKEILNMDTHQKNIFEDILRFCDLRTFDGYLNYLNKALILMDTYRLKKNGGKYIISPIRRETSSSYDIECPTKQKKNEVILKKLFNQYH